MTGRAIDYSTTEVSFYKFVCNDPEVISTYVGHTTNFTKRKSHHKYACKSNTYDNHNCKIYQTIRDNGGWDNWRMIEIESRLVKDKREAERIEQEFMEQLQSDMNTRKSYTTIEETNIKKKEYYESHKEQYSIFMKAYNQEHKEEIAIRQKAYNQKHKEQIAMYMKEYQLNNKEELAIKRKANRERVKDAIN